MTNIIFCAILRVMEALLLYSEQVKQAKEEEI